MKTPGERMRAILNDKQVSPQTATIRPAALSSAVMGHVKDTEHVRRLEEIYKRSLIGYSAKWTSGYRTQILDGQWVGAFPMFQDDLEIYE